MLDSFNWFIKCAPFWDKIENRHLSTYIVEKIERYIESPALIIGAGQGLIVEYLLQKGFIADGLDILDEMIHYAKERHNIDLIKGDANNLPFADNSYKSVIIATGVVDYNPDIKSIERILSEALRVTAIGGNMFVTHYRIPPNIERVYRDVGIIDNNNIYRMRRTVDIDRVPKSNPIPGAKLLQKWRGISFFQAMVAWTKVGITLPKELKAEQSFFHKFSEEAKKYDITEDELQLAMPDELPYKTEAEVMEMYRNLCLVHNEFVKLDDAYMVRFYKSNIYNSCNASLKKRESIDDWIIKLTELTKKYKGAKSNAIDHLSLSIPKGKIFGILGPNGAGKTTTLSIICGLKKPTFGEYKYSDEVKEVGIKNALGYVPQELALYPKLTCYENIKFFGELYKVEKKTLEERIAKLLNIVGLDDRKNDFVKNFSTGMMRRLNLAIALVHHPKILLLDEPTVGIDPQSRNCIFEVILKLKTHGITVIYTTHYMEEGERLCDEIAIIDMGRIIIEGNPKSLVDEHGFYRIVFNLDGDADKQFLNEVGKIEGVLNVSIKENTLTIISNKKENNLIIPEQVDAISKKMGIKLYLSKIFEPNLESLFLDITGRSLRDTNE